MVNSELLRERIDNSGLKIVFIASRLGISGQAFRNKMNNKSEFTASELKELSELLNVKSLKEMNTIFFNHSGD
jgi:transcriptional regulator with XRE-family HTH domain